MHKEIKQKFELVQSIRNFFLTEGFLDVLTPPIVSHPGIEPHIHPFKVVPTQELNEEGTRDLYLHSSPEFCMKELLSHGLQKIFTLNYSFRNERKSPHHRQQFLMLEWYRANEHYYKIMDDCENLWSFCHEEFLHKKIESKAIRMTVSELFQKHLSMDILKYLEKGQLREFIIQNHPEVPLPEKEEDHNMTWDDYFFLLFLNKIEPQLKNYPFLILYEYPHHLSALSTIKADNPLVCERFELYIHGIEVANCFNELCDLNIQKKRAEEGLLLKNQLYNYSLPTPNLLYRSLDRGLPPSSGVALGVERWLMALTNIENPFLDTDNATTP
jgi:lysyl-tRNA synthetase class 2